MENLEQLRKELHKLIDDKIDGLKVKEEKIVYRYAINSFTDVESLLITPNQLERIKSILNEKQPWKQ